MMLDEYGRYPSPRRNDDPPHYDWSCEVCFQSEDHCTCKRCRECDEVGKASCYREDEIQVHTRSHSHHGMMMTAEQWRLRGAVIREGKKQAEREDALCKLMTEDDKIPW
jgi:hypothetical protein